LRRKTLRRGSSPTSIGLEVALVLIDEEVKIKVQEMAHLSIEITSKRGHLSPTKAEILFSLILSAVNMTSTVDSSKHLK
jgi:hypothetical protein